MFGRLDEDELGTSPLDGVVSGMKLAPFIDRLFALKKNIPKKGRLAYQRLPEQVKAQMGAFVAELKAENEYIRNLTEEYADSKCRLATLYDSDPENLEAHRTQALADKLIANKIFGVVKTLLAKDRELSSFEYTAARREYYTEQMVCEILMMLEQNVISMEVEYDQQQKVMGGEKRTLSQIQESGHT